MANQNNTGVIKYAILKVFGIISLAFIIAVLLMLAAQALGLDITAMSNELMLVNSLSYATGIVVMLFIAWRSAFTLREIGFCRPENTVRMVFSALIAVHIIYLLILWRAAGIRDEATAVFIMLSLLLSILVGVCEELIFRGLVYRYLLKFGVSKAVFFSSILFGVVHLTNTVTGVNNLAATLLQISNAFVFGWAAVSLRVITKSLWPSIIWHFLIDSLSLIFDFSFLTIGGWAFIIANIVFNTVFALWLRPQIKHLYKKAPANPQA